MLRRFAVLPAASSSATAATAAATATAATAQRMHIVFTEQSAHLQHRAKASGFTSNVWAQEVDFKRAIGKDDGNIKLKGGEVPTEVRHRLRRQFVNLADLPNRAQKLARAQFADGLAKYTADKIKRERTGGVGGGVGRGIGREINLVSGKELPRAVALELERKYPRGRSRSKLWLTVRRASALHRTPPVRDRLKLDVFVPATIKLYNASQCADPATFAAAPVRGMAGEHFRAPDAAKALSEAVAERKYPTGLFFTRRELALRGLEVVDGAEPVKVHSEFTPPTPQLKLWNLEQVRSGEKLAEELGRPAVVDAPALFPAGTPIKNARVLEAVKAEAAAKGYKSQYWLDRTALVRTGRSAAGDALVIALDIPGEAAAAAAVRKTDAEYFSVHQLKSPEAGFRAAGSERESDRKARQAFEKEAGLREKKLRADYSRGFRQGARAQHDTRSNFSRGFRQGFRHASDKRRAKLRSKKEEKHEKKDDVVEKTIEKKE